MGNLERFKIDLKGLIDELTTFDFRLEDDYFETLGATEVKGGSLDTTLEVKKTAGVYDLRFDIVGDVVVTCDICLDDLSLPVDTSSRIEVRLGDSYDDEGEMMVVPADEGIVDVAWLIYEQIVLALPTRHVHEEGGCNPDMLSRIEQMAPQTGGEESAVDPRWSELEKLKSTIKE